jgi:hypothetical protein
VEEAKKSDGNVDVVDDVVTGTDGRVFAGTLVAVAVPCFFFAANSFNDVNV